jgi:hypothetical protein
MQITEQTPNMWQKKQKKKLIVKNFLKNEEKGF